MKMKIFGTIIGLAFLLLTMTSCSSVSYMPKISLDSSPSVINKNVKFEKLTDSSPKTDQENPFMGFSVTNPDALSSELTTEITNEIVRDFQTNDVFQKINKYEKDPEIFITGEIRKFKGVTKFTNYGLISFITVLPIYTWYLGIPIKKNDVEIEIALTAKDKNGNSIGAFSGKYNQTKKYSMYKNASFALQSQTNKGLSDVVSQIRNQMIDTLGKN